MSTGIRITLIAAFLLLAVLVTTLPIAWRQRSTPAALSTTAIVVSRDSANYTVARHTIDGHHYLVASHYGGIIHAASCTNTACVPARIDATGVIYRQGPHWIKDTPVQP